MCSAETWVFSFPLPHLAEQGAGVAAVFYIQGCMPAFAHHSHLGSGQSEALVFLPTTLILSGLHELTPSLI